MFYVGELFCYKHGDELPNRSFETLLTSFMDTWSSVCDKLQIRGEVAGSDRPRAPASKATHARTGLAEKHIDLLALAMLKKRDDLAQQGLDASRKELVQDACMTHDLLRTFNGAAPAAGVFWRHSSGLY
eukprot:4948313-Pyramimonas_sp.AAC.1